MTDSATLQTYLDDAIAARHALATGQTVVELWRDGRRVNYSQATLSQLTDYIKQLQQEIAQAQALEAGTPRRRAIGGFVYSDR